MINLSFGFCGLDCEKCPVLIADRNNDIAFKQETVKKWNALYKEYTGKEFEIEDMHCKGCRAMDGHFAGCLSCIIRKCAMDKKLESCALCASFDTCEMIGGFLEKNPSAKEFLNSIR